MLSAAGETSVSVDLSADHVMMLLEWQLQVEMPAMAMCVVVGKDKEGEKKGVARDDEVGSNKESKPASKLNERTTGAHRNAESRANLTRVAQGPLSLVRVSGYASLLVAAA